MLLPPPLLLVALMLHAAVGSPAEVRRPWMDASQPVATRVEALMKEMTLEEKAGQLLHTSIGIDHSAPAVQAAIKAGGMGAMTIEANTPENGTTCSAACRIGRLRELQLAFLNGTRLGIPLSFVVETSHCGAAGGTIFPMGVTQGSTWNTSLAHEVGQAIAKEARAWGGDRGLSPEINVCNDPRFGRIEENFGEDPAHVSAMTVAAVTGLQGAGAPSDYLPDDEHVVCEAKHCCAYGAGGRDGQSADISPKTLHDIYLRPWDAFVKAGGRGMMLAHNELNGVQMHANAAIMTQHFRTELGFEGFFASDAGNVGALVGARVAYNQTDAAAMAMRAGMDQTMGGGFSPTITVPGVKNGEIDSAWVDRACAAVLTQKFAAGLFDGALPDPSKHVQLNSVEHRQLARQTATEGAVLLRNPNNTLPLDIAKIKKIAIVGPNAGCENEGLPPAPPAPPGQCDTTQGIDCPGDDIQKVNNVSDTGACCKLCLANKDCVAAVLAVGALPGGMNQCLMKSSCDAPTTMPGRVVIQTGRKAKGSSTTGQTPWSCLAQRAMLGGYSNLEQQTDAHLDNHAHVVTVLEAARAAANASDGALEVSYSPGVKVQSVDTSGIQHAADTAKDADVALIVVGDSAEAVGYDGSVKGQIVHNPLNASENNQINTTENNQRRTEFQAKVHCVFSHCGAGSSIALPGVQLDLINAVLATGTPSIIVLVHGRPASFGEDSGGAVTSKFGSVPLYLRADALVAAWRPGVEGGNAIWSLLTGEASFSGRLAQSWPHNAGAVHFGGISPWYEKYCSEECPGLTENIPTDHGLSLDPTSPAFPFGYGLDYLDVSILNSSAIVTRSPVVTSASMGVTSNADRGNGVEPALVVVHVHLHNDAAVGGQYVVQVYFTPPVSPSRLTRYRHMLGGFAKVHIDAHADAEATVKVMQRDLAHWVPSTDSESNGHTVDPGEYTLFVCHDSRGLGGDQGQAQGIKAEDGKCQSHVVTI